MPNMLRLCEKNTKGILKEMSKARKVRTDETAVRVNFLLISEVVKRNILLLLKNPEALSKAAAL